MTIYVVTSGEYSDYGIEGIFSTRKLAQEFSDKHTKATAHYRKPEYADDGDCEIQEWTLDEERDARVQNYWNAEIGLESGTIHSQRQESDLLKHDEQERSFMWGRIETHIWAKERTAIGVSSKSQEHANKLAIEARQKWLREGKPDSCKLTDDEVAVLTPRG